MIFTFVALKIEKIRKKLQKERRTWAPQEETKENLHDSFSYFKKIKKWEEKKVVES